MTELFEELIAEFRTEAVECVNPVGGSLKKLCVRLAPFLARTHELDEATAKDDSLIEPPDVGESRNVA